MNLLTTCKKNVFECANKVQYCFDMKPTLQPTANSTHSAFPTTTAHNITSTATTGYFPTTTTSTDHTTATTPATTTLQSTTMLTEPLLTTTAAHTNHLTKTDVVAIAVSIVFMIVFIVGVGICYVSLTFFILSGPEFIY